MAEITVLCVTQNNKEALRLAIESLRYYHPNDRFLIWVWDNNSTDGAQEWARENCDRLIIKDRNMGHHHGEPLDQMSQIVETPYILTLDNDVCFKGRCIPQMLDELRAANAFAIGPTARCGMGSVNHHGLRLYGQPRVDPCCALFDAPLLARFTKHVTFSPYECVNLGKFYDTGAMIRHAAEGAGHRIVDASWIWDHVIHFGAMTWAMHAADGSPERHVYKERVATVREHMYDIETVLKANTEVVLARYTEPIDWVGSNDLKATIYDKSGVLGVPNALPNFGREAQTYAEHVARNYDKLAEVTVFAQADPFDHVPDFVAQTRKPTAYIRVLGENRMFTWKDGDECHRGLPIDAFYKEMVGRPPSYPITFAPGACFVVHRSLLQKYPQSWWRRLADRLVDEGTQAWGPWTAERTWAAILTAPPIPHYYHTVVGWFCAHKLYSEVVRNAADGFHFVEIGSWVGRSAAYMAVEIANSHKQIAFDVVDTFKGSPGDWPMQATVEQNGGSMRKVFDENLSRVGRYISTVHEMTSLEAAEKYPYHSLDFVFIDGDHAEEAVRADIATWFPRVKPGGVIAGDDYSYAHPGVKAAVNQAFPVGLNLETPPIWVYRIPR